MKITIGVYLILSIIGLFRIIYEILDCMVSYKYETIDIYGHLDSKFLWLFVFTIYIFVSIIIIAIALFKLRNKK